MNPLLYMNAKTRTVVYTVIAVFALAVGTATVGLMAAGIAIPAWLVALDAAVPFLASGLGIGSRASSGMSIRTPFGCKRK